MQTGKKSSVTTGRIFAFFFGFSILLGTAFYCFYFCFARPALTPVQGFAKALENLTEHKVEVSGHTVSIEDAEVMELAVIQRKIQSIVRYKTTWLKSKKLLILRGNFVVKTGYDLSQSRDFTIQNGIVSGFWPQPRILSLELKSYEIYHKENGAINRLQPADQQAAVQLLLEQAREDVLNSDLFEETDEALQRRVSDLSHGHGFHWKPLQN